MSRPRSPGSALKPHLCSRSKGLRIETVLFDRPRYGSYAPENFDLGYRGR
jgi:penicillin-binding protein 1C